MTATPTALVTACARGAIARNSFSAPDSSGSKWLYEIQRSAAGSIRLATASRVAPNILRMPVWKSSGSSSRTRNWLSWIPNPEWKVEIRNTSRAISVTVLCMSSLRPVRAALPPHAQVQHLDENREPERAIHIAFGHAVLESLGD